MNKWLEGYNLQYIKYLVKKNGYYSSKMNGGEKIRKVMRGYSIEYEWRRKEGKQGGHVTIKKYGDEQ